MIFTEQTFNEYPNCGSSDKRFTSPRQVTDADPTLFKEFAWGNEEADRLQESLRPAPAGHAHAARRLRAGQEVSDARVLLRADVRHAPQLPAAGVRRPAAHGDVRERRLSRAAAGRRVRDRQAGHVRARLRDERREEGDRAGLRRPRAHRPAGTQLGRLPVVVHRHANRHVRGRRHRRAADGPDELLRDAVSLDRHDPGGDHGSGAGTDGRGRHAVEPSRSLREPVADPQRAEHQDAVHDPAGHGGHGR